MLKIFGLRIAPWTIIGYLKKDSEIEIYINDGRTLYASCVGYEETEIKKTINMLDNYFGIYIEGV